MQATRLCDASRSCEQATAAYDDWVHEMDGAWGCVKRSDRPALAGIECGRDPRSLVKKSTRCAGREVTAATTNQGGDGLCHSCGT